METKKSYTYKPFRDTSEGICLTDEQWKHVKAGAEENAALRQRTLPTLETLTLLEAKVTDTLVFEKERDAAEYPAMLFLYEHISLTHCVPDRTPPSILTVLKIYTLSPKTQTSMLLIPDALPLKACPLLHAYILQGEKAVYKMVNGRVHFSRYSNFAPEELETTSIRTLLPRSRLRALEEPLILHFCNEEKKTLEIYANSKLLDVCDLKEQYTAVEHSIARLPNRKE